MSEGDGSEQRGKFGGGRWERTQGIVGPGAYVVIGKCSASAEEPYRTLALTTHISNLRVGSPLFKLGFGLYPQ